MTDRPGLAVTLSLRCTDAMREAIDAAAAADGTTMGDWVRRVLADALGKEETALERAAQ